MIVAMHTVIAGAAGASMAAASGITAQAVHTDTLVMMVPAVISAVAAVIGASVALISYIRHRSAADALEKHQLHDDERFDRLEAMVEGMASGPGHRESP